MICRAYCIGLTAFVTFAVAIGKAEQKSDSSRTISGIVMEFQSGIPDVPVCLCDADTGLPLAKDTYEPFEWEWGRFSPEAEMAIAVSDKRGRFRFDNVKDGKYRLVAQRWLGPFKGVFQTRSTVIQLMGSVDDIVVPSQVDPRESRIFLRPPGDGIVQLDQDVGNDSTFMLLSSSPPEFDPILGPSAMGTSFLRNLIGVNIMPRGKTTVMGAPRSPMYAFFIAPDNSPGFASIDVPASTTRLVSVPKEPFVAGWSDGRKTPPPNLAELMTFLETHSIDIDELLKIPRLSAKTHEEHRTRMRELSGELSREIELPEGKSTRVGDLLAVKCYQRLAKIRKR